MKTRKISDARRALWGIPKTEVKPVIEYAVIPWNALNVYVKSKAVKWYASEKAAQKYADKKNTESNYLHNLVVRPSNYINMSA